MPTLDPRPILISALCGLLIGAAITGIFTYKIEHADVIAAENKTIKLTADIATARAEGEAKARAAEQQSAMTIADISQRLHDTEVHNAQLESDRNAAIAAGTQRVYVRASCPPSGSKPENTAATSGANDAGIELDPAYRSTLSDLRRGVQSDAAKIIGLQAYARECARLTAIPYSEIEPDRTKDDH